MKLSILVFLVIGATLIFFGCSENNPSAPGLSQSDQVTHTLAKPHLTGTTDADFTGVFPYFWVGTIIIDDVTYGLRFESVGPPPPLPPRAFVFKERFEIWNEDFSILYLAGTDDGVLNYGNSKFVANGEVDVANFPFEMYLGRNVHISGTVIWEIFPVLPDQAIGTLRIN
jgi:hypothetical protein